jgi:16S rRNA (cytidine1402-2'-O)-methyltransferase
LANVPGTLVFFESPHRVADTLADLAAVLGARSAALARELTKHFETVRRGLLPDLASTLAAEPAPKGEIVLLVGPPSEDAPVATGEMLDAKITKALETLSVKEAATVVAAETGQPRRQIYARAIELSARGR